MSHFLLDTNVISEALKSGPTPEITAWITEQETNCFTSVIVVAELEYGITLLPPGRKKQQLTMAFDEFLNGIIERILPFDVDVARRWATLRAKWKRQGKPLPVLDSMIEATALHWNLAIVTRNTSDFVEAPTFNPWLRKTL